MAVKNYNSILSGFLIILLVFAMASCLSEKTKEQGLGYRIIESSKTIEDTASYSIKLEFPVFVSENDSNKNLETLNLMIEGFLDTAARYYWGMPPDSTKKMLDETGAAGIFSLDNRYTILDTTQHLVSIKMETYSFALGAHGFTAIHTYNFNVKTGQFIRFNDVLNLEGSASITKLNDLLRDNFENPENCFNDDPTADRSFELFAFDPENMIFYYEAYELGAYYCGMTTVKVPVKKLIEAGLLRKDMEHFFTR